jgi:two-component system, OmpR family, response regulator
MRILAVEDDVSVLTQISDELVRAGYLVDTASDGEDAWCRGETENYAAIILDLGLPRMDGLSILRRWRASGVTTPVLMVTARASWMERVEGIDAGADDYLPKPFYGEELVARLAAVLRRAAGHAGAIITAGAITLDTRRMTATCHDKHVTLTPLEFRLLRYLVHNKDRVVPQAELFEHIYANEAQAGSNALEVLVNRMRKKLGPGTVNTKRGYGYFLDT